MWALLASRVSIPRRTRWPRSLTGLEYSNRCYPTKGCRFHAFFCAVGGPILCIEKDGDFNSSTSLNGLRALLHLLTLCLIFYYPTDSGSVSACGFLTLQEGQFLEHTHARTCIALHCNRQFLLQVMIELC